MGELNRTVSNSPILVIAGTRPEIIKLAPVVEWLERLRADYVLVWSGQHYDYEMSRIFFEQLGIPEPDMTLDVGSGSHAEQTAKAMIGVEKVIARYEPSIVVAEGDTNTVVAAALTAVKMWVPFAHVEAGLRSWDRTMPEEVNRVVADALAELLFAPTELAAVNLMHEGVPLDKIYITGNTIVDVVLKHEKKALAYGRRLMETLGLEPYGYFLVTVHRQENTDNPCRLADILKALKKLAKHFPVVFPVHPRTLNRLKRLGLDGELRDSGIITMGPLGYFQFLGLLAHSLVVLTDSGGVQEEACTLAVPCVTLRYNTERPETVAVGLNKIVGTDPVSIMNAALSAAKRRDEITSKARSRPNPLGDGKAGEKIARILKEATEHGIRIQTTDSRQDPYITYAQISSKANYTIIALYTQEGLATCDIKQAHTMVVRAPLSLIVKLLKSRTKDY